MREKGQKKKGHKRLNEWFFKGWLLPLVLSVFIGFVNVFKLIRSSRVAIH